MPTTQQLDFLLVDADALGRSRLAQELERQLSGRASQHASARAGIGAFTRARFNAIVVGPALEDLDPWRFLRMVRSGRFGYAETPAFVVCDPESQDSVLPLLDPFTQIVSAATTSSVAATIGQRLHSVKRDRVLIVEDEPAAAAAAERALGKYFHTDVALDGESALLLWMENRHDLVLLDLMLPRMPGREVLTTLLAHRPDQVVIVLTAHDDTDRHQDLILCGAAEFLTKPIDVHFLAEACARVLRESRQLSMLAKRATQDKQLQELAARIHAADYSLKRGQTASATHHLNHALRACRSNAPSDDQWTTLLNDFS